MSSLTNYFPPSVPDAYILRVLEHQPPALHQSVFNKELEQSSITWFQSRFSEDSLSTRRRHAKQFKLPLLASLSPSLTCS